MTYSKKFKLKFSLHDEVFRTWHDEKILTCEVTPSSTGIEISNVVVNNEVISKPEYRLLLKASITKLQKEFDRLEWDEAWNTKHEIIKGT